MFKKVLIANRGEIAVRIIRACRELGISPVAVYSEPDRNALHVKYSDESYCIGPASSQQSYLNMEKIIKVAEEAGVEAIHPGYGFLAENANFARRCEECGFVFIGPKADTIEKMGYKVTARKTMMEAGVPVVPGTVEPIKDDNEAFEIASEIGYPIILKAAAGGGGKGMRLVRDEKEMRSALRGARSEGLSAFGDDALYIEKYIERPRHIEIQILSDMHGNTVHLFERECSIQRRHQKVIEETPSPFINDDIRKRMGEVAVRAARAARYLGAGTVEFIVDRDKNFYFLEMNTRIQVEHPITEMVTGIDIVKTQIEIAAGKEIPFKQEDIRQHGWAIECRIYAEDPENNFFPAPGRIYILKNPSGPGIRDDCGIYEGCEVSVHYDPLISKLVAWGRDRREAIERMKRALREYVIVGVKTTIPFHIWALEDEDFIAGNFDTTFIERKFKSIPRQKEDKEVAGILSAILTHINEKTKKPTEKSLSQDSAWKIAGRRMLMNRL